jgi:hypothetical protein
MNTTWNIVNTAEASVDHAFTFGDIDNNGTLDIMGWRVIWPNRYFSLYRNDLPVQNWVRVRPVGLTGNKGAAGAKIRIYKPGTDSLLWFEEVVTYCKQAAQGYGYAFAQTERHYGLGGRTLCDVEVQFYPSGTKIRRNGVAAKTTVTVSESATGVRNQMPNNAPVSHRSEMRLTVRARMTGEAARAAQAENHPFCGLDGRLVKRVVNRESAGPCRMGAGAGLYIIKVTPGQESEPHIDPFR